MWQLSNICCDPPRLVVGQRLRRRRRLDLTIQHIQNRLIGRRTMIDHLARAKEMRARARKCQVAADHSKSEIADCYRLLAENYDVLANLEEEFVAKK